MESVISTLVTSVQDLVTNVLDQLPNFALGLVLFLIFYYLAKWLRGLVRSTVERAGASEAAGMAIGRLAQWTTVLGGLLLALSIAFESFNVGELVQLLGISSVAIGFAFRDILQNFLAGFLILLTEPFTIGDQIIVNEYEGTVEKIDTRATKIRTYDGRQVVIPNSDMFTESVTVNTAFEVRRSDYDIGIGYGDDIEVAEKLIQEAMEGVPEVLETPAPDVRVWDLADSTVNIRARWWTNSQRSDVTRVKSAVLKAITQSLAEHGVDMPFPTQVVLFHDQSEETDGHRLEQREGWPVAPGQPVPAPRTIAGALQSVARALSEKNSRP